MEKVNASDDFKFQIEKLIEERKKTDENLKFTTNDMKTDSKSDFKTDLKTDDNVRFIRITKFETNFEVEE